MPRISDLMLFIIKVHVIILLFGCIGCSGFFGSSMLRLTQGFPKLTTLLRRIFQPSTERPKFKELSPSCVFPRPSCDPEARYRSADGYCNNLANPVWGTPGWPFKRILPPLYDDGSDSPRVIGLSGSSLPSAREVSRRLHTPDSDKTTSNDLSSMFTQFGQFLDHDLDLTPKTRDDAELDCCEETIQFPVRGFYVSPPKSNNSYIFKSRPLPGTCFNIDVPQPDQIFNKPCMNFVRSKVFSPSYKCYSNTREQGNTVTSFIDASQIYGSTLQMQKPLREFRGGRLRGESHDMLPSNSSTTCRSSKLAGKYCFGAGDVRVNEQPMLSALHLVFHRYHNYIADILAAYNPSWNDETVFQESRKIVGAVLQHIIYAEYLPRLLGPYHMDAYGLRESTTYRYEASTDPRIINSFAAAAFRFGHSMVPGHLMFGTKRESLDSVFFSPHVLQRDSKSDLANLIDGTIKAMSQGGDRHFASAVSQKLFRDEVTGRSLDLVSLNIQRGRDHGLPSYQDFRKACKLPKLTGKESDLEGYLNIYRHVDDIDLYSGAMSESPVLGGAVGETFACIIAQQFHDLKYGDRFWFENSDPKTGFSEAQIAAIKGESLASIFCTVSGITNSPLRALRKISRWNPEKKCSDVPALDLSLWMNAI